MDQPLPDLESEYPVSQQQIEKYRENGHILLRNVCSREEIEAYHPHIGTTTGRYNKETRRLEDRDTYGRAFLQVTNLWRNNDEVKKFVLARRFGRIAARLMGATGSRLYHDQALYKEPGGGPTPWHQDQFYWPLEPVNTVTMWMPLVDVPIEKGVLTFASKSHRDGSLSPMEISDASEQAFDEIVRREGFPIAAEGMQAGDATFHSGWTLHRAPGNQTESLREVMTIIFFPDGTMCAEPANKYQTADLAAFIPGRKPGEPADSELNPLIYSEGTV